ncbi:hypothetical protein [Tunturibacter empetritectus]|uniref:Uncharacterized protein n=1 Tax=Tunturiibacter lichenicola TaxID=2051959 RepID=A0A7W8N3C1_9BACT|nr:hypothetical protein [Edaphobacter lichenicola]MBB5343984.1 hypothetical protein [Edaphobacter lichenicola]
MRYLSGAPFVLILHASLCVPTHLSAATIQVVSQDHAVLATVATWKSAKAEHVYGLPDMKPNKKGTLTLSGDALTFTGKSGNTSIQRSAVTAVSAGNQRVEIWGIGGRLLRMTIPDGGGVAAAAVMHHRVDMLTVEFTDSSGGYHAAVFLLPAKEADRALESFVLTPVPPRKLSDTVCRNAPIEPKSVLVSAPNWDQAEVPAAYRALVYEHLIDRIQSTKEVAHVYRGGEDNGQGACPQYKVHLSIATFKEGSSVKRAALGPAGMFVGTTQMKFDVTFTDSSGRLNTSEQITATMRGESESTNVADHVAKSIAKHYATVLKNADKSNSAKNTVNPAS